MKGRKKTVTDVEMPLLEHFRELRSRLIISIVTLAAAGIIAWFFYNPIIAFLQRPIEGSPLYVLSVFEGFLMRVKISLFTGIIISSPVIIFNILRFVFPGLTNKEKTILRSALIACTFLAVISFYLSYFTILPFSIRFLLGSSFIPYGTGQVLQFDQTITILFQFIIAALILFQFPVVLEILMFLGVLRRKTLLKNSRYVIICIFILTAIITPPDVFSQIYLAVPLILLYFLSIGVAVILKIGG